MQGSTETITLRLGTGVDVRAAVRIGDGGTRPKVLLLHGNPGSLGDWLPVWPLLSAFADVAAIDLPGFGASARPDRSAECLALERLADHALATADALGWRERIYLVGHSHGGGVAQAAAARSPDRVAGLVLLATLGSPAHGKYRLLSLPGAESVARLAGQMLRAPRLTRLSRLLLGQVLRDIYSPAPVPAARVERELTVLAQSPDVLVSMVHVALGKPCDLLAKGAKHIRCPVFFLHGAEDAVVPWPHARKLHELIVAAGGSSRWHLIGGAGHMLIDDHAVEIAESMRAFVGGGRAAR